MVTLEARRGAAVTLPPGWRPGQRRELSPELAADMERRYPGSFVVTRRGGAVAAPAVETPWTGEGA